MAGDSGTVDPALSEPDPRSDVVDDPWLKAGRTFFRASSVVGAAMASGLTLRVVSAGLLAFVLGPTGQGTVVLATLIATLGAGVASLGLEAALMSTAALARTRAAARCAVWTQTLSVAGVTVAVLLPLTLWVDTGQAVVAGLIALPGLLFNRLTAACALGERREWSFAWMTVLPPCAYALVVGALAATDSLTTGSALQAFGACALATAVISGATSMSWLGLGIDWKPWRNDAYILGIKAFPSLLAQLGNYRFDQLVIAVFLSRTQLGLYAFAAAASEVGTLPAQATANALIPRVSRDRNAHSHPFLRIGLISGALALLAIPVFVAVVLVVLPDYEDSLAPFLVLLPGMVALALSKVLAAVIFGTGNAWVLSRVSLLALALTVPVTLLLTPTLGIVGAGLASSIAYCFAAWMLYRAAVRLGDAPPPDVR